MPIRTLHSLAELDKELAAADAASRRSRAEYQALLDGFVFDPRGVIGKLPTDPRSAEYREAQLRFYELIAGRGYRIENEATPFDHQQMMRWPFPYSSRSPSLVGDYLMTYGNLIKTMNLPAHARILEIGSGYGPLTYHLACMGHSVTCIDMSEELLAYVAQRTTGLPGRVETLLGDMNDLKVEGSFDVILFFESFHHCSDHVGLLRRLPDLLEPDGMLVLAGEPIVPRNSPAVPYPWGLRVDGMSLWVISRHGWLELGYEEPYLHDLLEDLGWNVVRKPSTLAPTMGIWMAKRKRVDSPYASLLGGDPLHVWEAADASLHSQFADAERDLGIRSNRRPGYLLFGPYIALDSGFYEVQWHGTADTGSEICVDVVCEGGGRLVRSADVKIGTQVVVQDGMLAHLRFKVDAPASDFEFRVRLDTQSQVAIERVVLRKY